MKTTVVSLLLVSLLILPAVAVDVEVGSYNETSVITPYGDNARAIVEGGLTPYMMFFWNKHVAMDLEWSMGMFSVFDTSSDDVIFSLGAHIFAAQVAYYLRDHSGNNPYLLARVSHTNQWGSDFPFHSGDFNITSLGTGIGYQYHIKHHPIPGFVIRTELRYNRLFVTSERDFTHEFSWVIGIGIR